MGQYYIPILKIGKGKIKVYSNAMNELTLVGNGKSQTYGGFQGSKLMEHSWWDNDLLNAIGSKIYKKKSQLIWLGDYAEDEDFENFERVDNINLTKLETMVNIKKTSKLNPVPTFTFNNKYLVNHTKKIYIELNKYYNNACTKDGWCANPLSLLTAIGNGKGGGDYYSEAINADVVGSWAWDIISIEDKAPKDYEATLIIFDEEDY